MTLKHLLEILLREDKQVSFYYPNYIWIENLKMRMEVFISEGNDVHYAMIVPVGKQHKILGNLLIKVASRKNIGSIDVSDVLELSESDLGKLLEDFNNLFMR